MTIVVDADADQGRHSMSLKWLRAHVPGFGAVSHAELQAIRDFSLLWSFFEAQVFPNSANAGAIYEAAQRWGNTGDLDDDPYGAQIAYFRDRYWLNGDFTFHFHDLRFRKHDQGPLVRAVLEGSENTLIARAATVFIVIYRYRNNLFHGAKWANGLAGQLGNFRQANAALMMALNRHAPP
jgi:hypothetical protein